MTLPRAAESSPRRPSTRRLVWGAVLFDLLLVVLAIGTLAWSRAQIVRRAEVDTQNLAEVLEQNLNSVFHQADLVLLAVKDEAEERGIPDRWRRIQAALDLQRSRSRFLASIAAADAGGRMLRGGAGPGGRVDPEPFFQQLQAKPGSGLLVTGPRRRPDGGWALVLARRLQAPDGRFEGAVFAELPLDTLAERLSLIDVGRRGSISLRGEDLGLLARIPALPNQDGLIGDTRIEGDYQRAVQENQRLRHFTAPSRLDGEWRTYTFLRVPEPRLYLLVSLAQADYLTPWRHQAWLTALTVLGLVALSAVAVGQARSTWLHQLAHQARLAQEEARFRLLADNALDVVWTLDPEGRLTYISPSIEKQRGWTPEAFMALDPSHRALSHGHGALVQAHIAAAHTAQPGSQPFEHERLLVPATCRDGREIQVEAQWRIVWGEDGALLGFQGVTRDVTERERLIGELTQALAAVKTLGGMLPICGNCKKIRDDQGYWNTLETYLAQHTDATFTHGICPDCAQAFRKEAKAARRAEDPGEPGPPAT